MTISTLAAAAAISTLPMSKTVIYFKSSEPTVKKLVIEKDFERHTQAQEELRRDRASGGKRAR